MKKFFFLSAVISVSAMGAPIGTCVPSTLSNLISNPCALGDMMFDNFSYSGDVSVSNINVDFQMVGSEFRLILTPVIGAGFFTNLSLTNRVSVISGVAPNLAPANYKIVGVKDQSNFSAVQGSSGLLIVANTPGPAFNLVPGNETGGPGFFPGTTTVITTSTLTGPGGKDSANPGLASLELDYIQANTAVPEPATLGLIGIALLGGGLFRRRSVHP
ncbi:MAG: PEP-CTERM sorting domain-containing protein [Acidobacteriia bacterium]|nr:PEP-CTERM sorting domain-containing protein [Terriglobia bacterium]